MDEHQPPPAELEVQVPGTPEEVWAAIATGPGISAWLHPTEVEERAGGRFRFELGGAGPREGTVTAWEPPRRFVQELTWEPAGDLPAARVATEWVVQARGDGTCTVRMTLSGFGAADGWDEELEGMAAGMRLALDTLVRYRTWFPGHRGHWLRAAAAAAGPPERAWAALTGGLGLDRAAPGQRVATGAGGGPAFTGVVERVGGGDGWWDLLVRVERPQPGFVNAYLVGQAGWAGLEACLYGDDAAAVTAREQPAWQAWLAARVGAAPAPEGG
jgi:uncharacterized protein YndB with AHSA1/START domain